MNANERESGWKEPQVNASERNPDMEPLMNADGRRCEGNGIADGNPLPQTGAVGEESFPRFCYCRIETQRPRRSTETTWLLEPRTKNQELRTRLEAQNRIDILDFELILKS